MRFGHFFIDRPVFAWVIAIMTVVVGIVAMLRLPITQYPDIAPPTVSITTSYPGANASVVAETVAQPIEEQVNGVEDMLYMSSTATNSGGLTITVTFRSGTDVDRAQVLVQNRVALAQPRLPPEVVRQGIDVRKRSPDLATVFFLYSPKGTYDVAYLSNYALLQIRDELARIRGVGDVQLFGAREYSIRVWLDPAKVSARDLTPSDVATAIREQNVQVAAGRLGQAPKARADNSFELVLTVEGRLTDATEFADIVLKTGADGQVVRLRDVARVELGARDYGRFSLFSGKNAIAIPTYFTPGANALETHKAMIAKMESLKAAFPNDIAYDVYDTIPFIEQSIEAVIHTLLEAIVLVVLVVVVFLQTWRASLIPLLAVPVSLVGTFAAMAAFGFGLNSLTLFGLVLAIGIVVDDSIVVVENMERHLAEGMDAKQAAYRTVDEVGVAVIGIAVVLTAVFVPSAFITGISGEFYRQFAITLAVAELISAFNSLTLAPALGAMLLRPHGAKKDFVQRGIDGAFGWFFTRFNKIFDKAGNGYGSLSGKLIRMPLLIAVLYLGLVALTALGFKSVPNGFVPTQDKGYFVVAVKLPDGASLDRTSVLMRQASDALLKIPGVIKVPMFAGVDIFNGFSDSSSAGVLFPILGEFENRAGKAQSADAIRADAMRTLSTITGAFIAAFPPPPVSGIGNVGGLKLQVQDRGAEGLQALQKATDGLIGKVATEPGFAGAFTTFRNSVPTIRLDVDRTKAKSQDVPLANVFDSLQAYLGSLYVNDFTRFGRNYRVYLQADAEYRMEPEQVGQLRTRNMRGDMLPLSTLVTARVDSGPEVVNHYNMYTSADINAVTLPTTSSGQGIAAIERLAKENLPAGFSIEWTELALQEKLAGNSALFIFPLSVLIVYLALAALYESWAIPIAIVLVAPLSLLASIGAVWLAGGDNNIFTQIGFLVLLALGAKNAILIVEFARQLEVDGTATFEAAVEAAKLRLRPILMTSFAFIFGVLPLVTSKGAGAEMRKALGIGVFGGMIGVTIFSLVLTPVVYVAIRRLSARRSKPSAPTVPAAPAEEGGHG
ncbi:efflux RND transporter permease subunit [Cupriavidus sp. CuC1]|uniref:efflux RND transporter permease subunit n=1 Tax=Cupriavidus sp. CuC1 TaxID=3373131 RepID=UPI0037D48DF6